MEEKAGCSGKSLFSLFLFLFSKRLLPQVNSAYIEVEMVKILFDI